MILVSLILASLRGLMLLSHTELNGAFVSHYMQHVVIVFGRDSQA